jgi:hypothetical protein
MKIIDLLNKIAKGEKIKKFKYKNRVFYSVDNDYWCDEIGGWFSVEVLDISILNDEVEIIEEEKEIEKINIISDTLIAFDDKYQDINIGGCTPTQIAFATKIKKVNI